MNGEDARQKIVASVWANVCGQLAYRNNERPLQGPVRPHIQGRGPVGPTLDPPAQAKSHQQEDKVPGQYGCAATTR